MDYASWEPTATHYEYIMDRREPFHQIKQQAFWFMDVLYHGWGSRQKADFLIDLILRTKPKTIVEIGVWGGKSVVPMACALKHNGSGTIYGIDPWDSFASIECIKSAVNRDFWYSVDHGAVYRGLVQKLHEFDLEPWVRLIVATSESADPIHDIDILHIDGNHSEEMSCLDVHKWVPLVRKGGFILFDDMTWCENDVHTTRKAVEWLDQHCFKLCECNDISVWGVWIKL